MNMNEIVKQLRTMSSECDDELVYLPSEITKIINGTQEEDWEMVRVDKTLHYIADMLEE